MRSVMKETRLLVLGTENELAKLASKQWLVQHGTSPKEIANLLALSDRDLVACQVKQLPADWRVARSIHVADTDAEAAAYVQRAGGTFDWYFKYLFKIFERLNAKAPFVMHQGDPPDSLTRAP